MEGQIGEAEEDCPLKEDKRTEVGQRALRICPAGKYDSSCCVSALGFVPFVFRAGIEYRPSCRPSNTAASHRGRYKLQFSLRLALTVSMNSLQLRQALSLSPSSLNSPVAGIIGLCHQAQMELWTF